jgi:hypothetical protein
MEARIAHVLSNKNSVTKSELQVILVSTALISLILSLTQWLSDPVINSDGIMYIQAASFIQKDDWVAASKLYNWLFYPLIVAKFSSFTTLSLEHSAHIINAVLSTITCLTFILLIKEFGGKTKSILCFSSLIILCYPNLNEYRNLIIRDHGYWAFYLLSCYFFIKAYKHISIRNVVFFVSSVVLATLFRVEGLCFLLTAPIVLFLYHLPSLKKTTVIFISLLIITLVLTLSFNNTFQSLNLKGFTKTKQVEQIIDDPSAKISSAINITESYINKLSANDFSNDYAPVILGFLFVLILSTEIFSATSPLYVLLLCFVLFKTKLLWEKKLTLPWIYFILVNIIILCGFLFSHYFIAGRYPIPLALTLILPLPFLAQYIYQKFRNKELTQRHLKIVTATIVFFTVLTIDGLISTGASKKYLKDAGEWVSSSQQEHQTSLFTNNQFVSFYSGSQNGKRIRKPSFDNVLGKLKKGQLKKFDLLAIQISRKNINGESALLNAITTKPIKVFKNNKGDSVLIFKQ